MSLTFYAPISSCLINIRYGWDFQKYFSNSEVQVSCASELQKHLWLYEEYPAPPTSKFIINTRLKPSISSELPQDSDASWFSSEHKQFKSILRFQVFSVLGFQLGFIQTEWGFMMWRNELLPHDECSITEHPILSSTVRAH